MLQPSLSFSGFTIHEPVTAFTNLILCVFCIVCAFNTHRVGAGMWTNFFFAMALATFAGALGHGLYDHESSNIQLFSRMCAIISVFFAGMASARWITNRTIKIVTRSLISVQLLVALFLILKSNDFIIVAINGTVGFGVIILLIHLQLYFRNVTGSIFILSGIVVNALAGMVHKFSLAPHKWFNHNDLSHIIMIPGLFLFSKGAIGIENYFRRKNNITETGFADENVT